MTPEDRKIIFYYLYPYAKTVFDAQTNCEYAVDTWVIQKWKLDGNDMVEAIKIIKDKDDIEYFMGFVTEHWVDYLYKLFGNPENFFNLLLEWRKEVEG